MQSVSIQCGAPDKDPLYPVAIILLSFTNTAPTDLRLHVERLAVKVAMFIKYSFHDGLIRIPFAARALHSARAREARHMSAKKRELKKDSKKMCPCGQHKSGYFIRGKWRADDLHKLCHRCYRSVFESMREK